MTAHTEDSPTETSSPSASAGRSGPLPESEAIAGDIEAMLLSSGKAISSTKLAVALGLIPEEDPEAAKADAPAPKVVVQPMQAGPASEDESGPEAEPAAEPAAKPKRKPRSKTRPIDADSLIAKAVGLLNTQYTQTDRSFRIEQIAGGYRFMTLARHAPAIAALHKDRDSMKLSRQAIETLAIIAYRQPITRAELEAIRGVACGEVLRSLMERRLVAIVGRSEELGRPMLYGTSKHFLDAFGLSSLKDLPSAAELKTAM
ncbi:MAG: SMC-Scp complex subunit ScpB [Phycisphaerales bacterium]|nr:SMC-Scp complex subunit ScpB [Phycisphaerales bacterium]